MTVVGRATLELFGEAGQFVREMQSAAQKFERIGSRLESAGGQFTKAVTLPIAAGLLAVSSAAVSFESSFAGIRKTMDLTETEFAQLAQSNRDLAKVIPVSANELNRIGELAGQLGIRGVNNVLKFEDTIAKLAVTTDLSAEQGALAFAQFANVMQLPQDQIDRLGAAVVDLGNNFATTESNIVDYMQRIGGAGQVTGLTAGAVAGIGAAFASIGVQAEAGGTAIQKVLISMLTAVQQGSAELDTFARTAGMSAESFAATFRDDAARAFAQFVEGLGSQGDAAIDTLEALGLQDQRLTRAFLGAAGAGDLLTRAIETGNAAFAANTALAEEASKRFETFASRLQVTWNRVKDVAITIGNSLLPVFNDLLDAVSPMIELMADFAGWFANLPKPIRATVTVLAAFAAAIGPVLIALGAFVAIIPHITTGLIAIGGALRFAMGPIGWIALGVAAITAAWKGLTAALDLNREASARQTKSIDEQREAIKKLTGEQLANLEAQLMSNIAKRNAFTQGPSKVIAEQQEILKRERALLREVRATIAARQQLDPISVATLTGGAGIGAAGVLSEDAQQALTDFKAGLDEVAALERLLGDEFDEVAAKAQVYSDAIRTLAAEGVSLNAVIGPQGETLKDLAQQYISLEQAIRATADAERMKQEGAALALAAMTAEEKHVATQERLAKMLEAGAITQDTYNRLIAKAREEFEETTPAGKALAAAMQQYEQIVSSSLSPLDQFRVAQEQLGLLLEAGKITTEEYARAVESLTEAFHASLGAAAPIMEQLEDFGVETAFRLADAFADMASSSEASFSDFVEAAMRDLARLLARAAMVRGIAAAFPGLGEALGIAGARAQGGPVSAHHAYLVGERGPELFVPGASGKILANDGLGGGVTVHQTVAITAQSLDPRTHADLLQQQKGTIGRVLAEAVHESTSLRRAIQGR